MDNLVNLLYIILIPSQGGFVEKDEPVERASAELRRGEQAGLFDNLFVSDQSETKGTRIFGISAIAHLIAIALLVLVPLMWPSEELPQTNYINVLLYDPPPPPPPPMMLGSSAVKQVKPSKPVTPVTKPDSNRPVLDEPRKEEQPDPEPSKLDIIQAGSETGSLNGVAEGMEDGIEGGQVGGVPGGVLGGVIGGTGDVVMDLDQQPRLIRQTKPVYPEQAAIRKIEGEVEVELVIGTDGRVRSVRVTRSVPILDTAALQCVYQWTFMPAIKNGKPVPTMVLATVRFSLL